MVLTLLEAESAAAAAAVTNTRHPPSSRFTGTRMRSDRQDNRQKPQHSEEEEESCAAASSSSCGLVAVGKLIYSAFPPPAEIVWSTDEECNRRNKQERKNLNFLIKSVTFTNSNKILKTCDEFLKF